jgi:CTP synthase (UTP-ammonia lyase)
MAGTAHVTGARARARAPRIGKLYGNVDAVNERHRHRYEVNPTYVPELEKQGMLFVGHDDRAVRMEIMELAGTSVPTAPRRCAAPCRVATQAHPSPPQGTRTMLRYSSIPSSRRGL